jgi:hypothetical protein
MAPASVSVFYQRVLSTLPLQSQFGRYGRSGGTPLQLGRGLREMSSTVDPFQDILRILLGILLEDFPTCGCLITFRQVVSHLGYTIPVV